MLLKSVPVQPREPSAALEAHGTGTALGDPVEVGAATAALCDQNSFANIPCTSIKGNPVQ